MLQENLKLETRIHNQFVIGMKANDINVGTENDVVRSDIGMAIKDMNSKSGGDGIARPDANFIINDVVVLVEFKWGLDKDLKINGDTVSLISRDVMKYADNGAVYYALNVDERIDDDMVYAMGVSGEVGDGTMESVNFDIYLIKNGLYSVIGRYKTLSAALDVLKERTSN